MMTTIAMSCLLLSRIRPPQYHQDVRRQIPPDSLARDDRFFRITTAERFDDPRPGLGEDRKLFVESEDVPDRARRQMHGIFVGEIQALEGLAIDVFTTMRDFADEMGDPVLRFCEDWMLADEVTHVKMGSRWLREVTEGDKERRDAALEFQRTVDALFNFGGRRGEDRDAAIILARRFREMAGFSTDEIDVIAEMAAEQRAALAV